MAFKLSKGSSTALDSPEALFRDLRQRQVQGLLSHQADILRDYQDNAIDRSDVAFELPTGSGKTLVGLLLGEWRRRKFGERVVYLCTTRQLVHQVAEQARSQYGFSVTPFTGRQAEYDPSAKNAYFAGETLAVTTYSGLFNTNPVFSNPHIIILDDAHAAENYVAEMWTLRIRRSEHEALFSALAGVLKGVLSPIFAQRLLDGGRSGSDGVWVDKLPTPAFGSIAGEFVATVSAHVEGTNLQYPWSLLHDRCEACHLYLSSRELLLRPLLPPTNEHDPFVGAKQRVYMSATLGESGDLERISGRSPIHRLRVPEGWNKQGTGRRFFVLPSRSLDMEATKELVFEAIWDYGRALLMVSDHRSAQAAREAIQKQLGGTDTDETKTFEASDIETSKKDFVESERAVAILAGRYDGIDFPGDECRLIVLAAFPKAVHLQERFLVEAMGATALLTDRIITRIVQAVGRCTRSATDYAAVLLVDDELQAYLLRAENRHLLHPELQAELRFGIEESKDRRKDELLENLGLFMEQGEPWQEADEMIREYRASAERGGLPGASRLQAAAKHELAYQYAMWAGDYTQALEACRSVLAQVEGNELQAYRAFWYYLAGSAAYSAERKGHGDFEADARDYFARAARAAPSVRWLVDLAMKKGGEKDGASDGALDVPTSLLLVIERLEEQLAQLGMVSNKGFEKEEAAILQGLESKNQKVFEDAHVRLGRLLGYDSGNRETQGAPDPWWQADEHLCFIFEDHAGAEAGSSLSVKKARQAFSHPNWVRENLPVAEGADVVPVLVSPVERADSEAQPHLKTVWYWNLDAFRKWASRALVAVRELRRAFTGPGDAEWRQRAVERYMADAIDPDGLKRTLQQSPASSLCNENERDSPDG